MPIDSLKPKVNRKEVRRKEQKKKDDDCGSFGRLAKRLPPPPNVPNPQNISNPKVEWQSRASGGTQRGPVRDIRADAAQSRLHLARSWESEKRRNHGSENRQGFLFFVFWF